MAANTKTMDGLPLETTIKGQPHMLAYITPKEAETLRSNGGGVTQDGGQFYWKDIPTFLEGDSGGVGDTGKGRGGSSGGSGGGNSGSSGSDSSSSSSGESNSGGWSSIGRTSSPMSESDMGKYGGYSFGAGGNAASSNFAPDFGLLGFAYGKATNTEGLLAGQMGTAAAVPGIGFSGLALGMGIVDTLIGVPVTGMLQTAGLITPDYETIATMPEMANMDNSIRSVTRDIRDVKDAVVNAPATAAREIASAITGKATDPNGVIGHGTISSGLDKSPRDNSTTPGRGSNSQKTVAMSDSSASSKNSSSYGRAASSAIKQDMKPSVTEPNTQTMDGGMISMPLQAAQLLAALATAATNPGTIVQPAPVKKGAV